MCTLDFNGVKYIKKIITNDNFHVHTKFKSAFDLTVYTSL